MSYTLEKLTMCVGDDRKRQKVTIPIARGCMVKIVTIIPVVDDLIETDEFTTFSGADARMFENGHNIVGSTG